MKNFRFRLDFPTFVIGFILYTAIDLIHSVGDIQESVFVTWRFTLKWVAVMGLIFWGGFLLQKQKFKHRIRKPIDKPKFDLSIDVSTIAIGYIGVVAMEIYRMIGETYPSHVITWTTPAEWLLSSVFVFYGGYIASKRNYREELFMKVIEPK